MTYMINGNDLVSIIQEPDCPLNTIECYQCYEVDYSIKEIVEALEKQVPKKLRRTSCTLRCGTCNKQITAIGAIHNNYRFCKYCGQAIDWEGVEE